MFSFLIKSLSGKIMKYYAVARGRQIGIYKSWAECKQQVHGYQSARFKKFLTKHEAANFIRTMGSENSQIWASAPFVNCNVQVVEQKQMESSSSVNAQSGQQLPEYKTANGIPIAYTDGACSNNGGCKAMAGIGVFWGDAHPDNVSAPIQGNATNNRAEYLAAINAIENALTKGYSALIIRTDSNLMIKSMTLWLKRWKKNGWKTKTGTPVANRDLLERLNELMGKIRVQFEKVEGHSDDYGNDQADQLAREGAKLYTG